MKPAFIEEIDALIIRYGDARQALNVTLAKLQAARAWIISQEKCPECFGDLSENEWNVGDKHNIDYICEDCGKEWLNIGLEVISEK